MVKSYHEALITTLCLLLLCLSLAAFVNCHISSLDILGYSVS